MPLKHIKISVGCLFNSVYCFFITDINCSIFEGKFLLENYKQALAVLDTRPAVLIAMEKVGAGDGSIVKTWLAEEDAYLHGLKKEPLQETLKMEYYSLLVALEASTYISLFYYASILLIITPQTTGINSQQQQLSGQT